MASQTVNRRGLLQAGGAAAGMSVLQISGPAQALAAEGRTRCLGFVTTGATRDLPGGPADDVLLWEDQPPPFPPGQGVGNQQVWEEVPRD